MIINHNLSALNTYNKMTTNNASTQNSLSKLSSGLRINKAGDDAAGLAISEKMRAQVRGLDQATRNAQDGVSLIQTAEGGLNEVHSILQRMRELADQSANGTNTADDRAAIQSEVTQLKAEIDRIGNTTEFNTQKLLNGNLSSTGASVGTNSTLGGVVAKLSADTLTSARTVKGDLSSVDFSANNKDVFVIDGQNVDVDWNTLLTTTQKSSIDANLSSATGPALNEFRDTIVGALNTAIDNFNAATGKNVQHISGYLDSNNKLVLESASKGNTSTVNIKTVGGATSVGAVILSDVVNSISNSSVGTAVYNGTSAGQNATNSKLTFNVNGVKLEASLTASITGGTTEMSAAATQIETALNTAISVYNSVAGLTAGENGYIQLSKVTVTADGRFSVANETGSLTFDDRPGETAISDLGLAKAQTEASGNGGMTFQIGANKNQTITFGIADMRSAALEISGIDVSSAASSQTALSSLDSAIKKVSSERAKLGAVQNRLEHTVNNLSTSSENLTAAESRIRDVDMAKEMMNFSKMNILSQAAQAMMAQANQQPQGVLQLLK